MLMGLSAAVGKINFTPVSFSCGIAGAHLFDKESWERVRRQKRRATHGAQTQEAKTGTPF
jgi:hypothetical protein